MIALKVPSIGQWPIQRVKDDKSHMHISIYAGKVSQFEESFYVSLLLVFFQVSPECFLQSYDQIDHQANHHNMHPVHQFDRRGVEQAVHQR